METSFKSIQIERPKILREQIQMGIRDLIVSGKLAPGEKIPTVRRLAEIWGANVATVHVALTSLAKQGLLVQQRGKGTYVRKREERLTSVALYYDEVTFGKSRFLQSLHTAIKAELNLGGIETDVWIDPRSAGHQGTPWAPFVRAAEHREFQAVIVPVTDLLHLRWQSKLAVPTAFLMKGLLPNIVSYDIKQFAGLSLQALSRQGCRSVGLITPFYTESFYRNLFHDGIHNPHHDFFQRFIDESRDLGLTIKDSWIRACRHDGDLSGRSADQYGYEQFLRLWDQPERPDGLVVNDDVAARGVLLALQQKQVRVPQELKLVFQKNEAVDLLCPMPATFVVSSERETAKALIEQIEKQFRGERCEPISLPYKLMIHDVSNREENSTTKKRKAR